MVSQQKLKRTPRRYFNRRIQSCASQITQKITNEGKKQPPFWAFGALTMSLVAVPTTVSFLQGELEKSESSDSAVAKSTATKENSEESGEKKESGGGGEGGEGGESDSSDKVDKDDKDDNDDNDEKGWVALYLDEKSQEKIKEQFGQHTYANVDGKYLTLQYNPSEEEYALITDTIGMENIQIEPVALVTSKTDQILYCDIIGQKNIDGGSESIRFDSRITSMDVHPHIVLSTTKSTVERDGVHETLAQVAASSLLDLSRNSKEFFWSGMMPAVEGGGESVEMSVQRISGLTLNSTVCTNFRWDESTISCKPPGECGFCKFMRAGPCGEVFTAWEDCIDACKKDDSDFVDICGTKTMALKDCVDAHPEYYGVLGANSESE
jgi:hypothetical protein